MRAAFDAALASVEAASATRAWLRAHPVPRPVHVLALGKASIGMTRGALEACEVRSALVIAPRGTDPGELPRSVHLRWGAHPVPDEDVAVRGAELLAYARALGPDEDVLVLISGGGSALVDVPAEGIDAEALRRTTRRLLAAGANIDELNALRVASSQLKGGGLARALAPRRVRTLVISDVVSSSPEAAARVASGPMSPWRGPSPAEVVARPHVAAVLTPGERARFAAWTPPSGIQRGTLEVVADNARAVRAAQAHLEAAGLSVAPGPALSGEAREAGRAWAHAARATPADALVAGGETVVTVRGRGKGGRSQEVALGALDAGIEGVLLCAGTDGIDGPTSAAGACIDAEARDALAPGAVRHALDDNDAFPLLASAGALVVTGPTGTNVADLAIWARAGARRR